VGEEVRRRASPRLILEIYVGERLPVGVADDEAGVRFLGKPGRWEAAGGHPLGRASRYEREHLRPLTWPPIMVALAPTLRRLLAYRFDVFARWHRAATR
jgi:hypothetical protein